MIVSWVAYGTDRGLCGHYHDTAVAAWRCAAGDDDRERRRAGHGPSDRTVQAASCAAIISGTVRLCTCADSSAAAPALREGAAEAATEAASRVVSPRPPTADPEGLTRQDLATPMQAAEAAARRVLPTFAASDINRIASEAVDAAHRFHIQRP